MNSKNVDLESDSLLVVNWLNFNRGLYLSILDVWEDIISFVAFFSIWVYHVFREVNGIADFFGKSGARGASCHFDPCNVPNEVKGFFRREKVGCCYLRCKQ